MSLKIKHNKPAGAKYRVTFQKPNGMEVSDTFKAGEHGNFQIIETSRRDEVTAELVILARRRGNSNKPVSIEVA